ncbi:HIT family protein [Halosquirtibacter laminarini]|uniref:HIT family protein n=1 Tax=Halosquirtibacter laminarini TaxID=3374600 RepID=A0AC61NGK6_9BACT|nr:HIT family protein [Prolixibacteraceae bacterium]
MATIFTKIIEGQIPSYKIAEDDKHYAFLDIAPLTRGHLLVVPKKEVDYIFDLEADEYALLQQFAHKVALGLKSAIPCNKVASIVLGLEVPHAHIHLIPMNSEKDVNFSNPKLQLEAKEFQEIAQLIRSHIN